MSQVIQTMMEASNQIVCLSYPDYDGSLKSDSVSQVIQTMMEASNQIVCLSYQDYDGNLKSDSVSQLSRL